jgi:hypothetical protein
VEQTLKVACRACTCQLNEEMRRLGCLSDDDIPMGCCSFISSIVGSRPQCNLKERSQDLISARTVVNESIKNLNFKLPVPCSICDHEVVAFNATSTTTNKLNDVEPVDIFSFYIVMHDEQTSKQHS